MNNRTHKPEYIARYRDGARARRCGDSEFCNPYPALTMSHTAWLAGFREYLR
jgi:hypothetical protein